MDKQPLFYKNPVPLNRDKHGDLYIEAMNDFGFARETNSVYLAAIEFYKAARDYPIVFGKGEEGEVFPAVLLGLEKNENRFIGKNGEWLAEYIPAYIRRYPFILATNQSVGSFAVCIDEAYPGFNRKKKGEPLYDENGEKTRMFQQAIEFLKDYQSHIQATAIFCKELGDVGILEPMEAQLKKGEESRSFSGFYCVNREGLKGLSPKQVQDLMLKDHLELIFVHLLSLNNLTRLVRGE